LRYCNLQKITANRSGKNEENKIKSNVHNDRGVI